MEKINIAEILKDCPSGMELDCTMWDGIIYDSINPCSKTFPIVLKRTEGDRFALTKYGQYNDADFAKCVIFPKGKTTWDGFVPPCKYKDGDIIYVKSVYEWVAIYKESDGDDVYKYVGIRVWGDVLVDDCCPLCYKGDIREIRHATEEEKQKLFDAIKANGYKWNAETKTLEKLIEPKFKVGDRIKHKYDKDKTVIHTINYIYYDSYGLCDNHLLFFKEQDQYELVPNKFDITTLKPFDKVLVRYDNVSKWCASFFSHIDKDLCSHRHMFITTSACSFPKMIPYEDNEHLLGTTNDCDEYYKTWEERL